VIRLAKVIFTRSDFVRWLRLGLAAYNQGAVLQKEILLKVNGPSTGNDEREG
jgi:hypothetical protein